MDAASSSFPKGLRVLLIDEQPSCTAIRTQLEQPELSYAVTSVSSSAEALSILRSGVAAFDVVLAESRVVAADEISGRAFVEAFEDTPVVLMSDCGATVDVMRAVQLGAVDFLDKPLSLLKLKNIWQHSVRKMMARAAGGSFHHAAAAAVQQAPARIAAPAPAPSSWSVPPSAFPSSGCLASLGPESPGTPTGSAADLAEAFSMGSMGEASVNASPEASVRGSLDCAMAHQCDIATESFMDAMASALEGPTLPRPSSFSSLPTPTSAPQWPELHAGCVWGTPAHGPTPPPMPAAPTSAWGTSFTLQPAVPEAPVLIKASGRSTSPMLPTCDPSSACGGGSGCLDMLMIPEGFLSDVDVFGKSSCGPLGLKLEKSPSLLNFINSALAADASGPAPMCF